MLKIGTHVRIKSYERIEDTFDTVKLYFNRRGDTDQRGMESFCGKTATIKYISSQGDFTLEGCGGWFWSAEWFEVIDSIPDSTKIEYEEGDKVVILSRSQIEETLDDCDCSHLTETQWDEDMEQYCGEETTITCVYRDGDVDLDCDSDKYFWSEEWIKPIASSPVSPVSTRVDTTITPTTYTKGDKVRIKSYSEIEPTLSGKEQDEVGFTGNMGKSCGKIVTIKGKTYDTSYDMEEISWHWHPSWFEPVCSHAARHSHGELDYLDRSDCFRVGDKVIHKERTSFCGSCTPAIEKGSVLTVEEVCHKSNTFLPKRCKDTATCEWKTYGSSVEGEWCFDMNEYELVERAIGTRESRQGGKDMNQEELKNISKQLNVEVVGNTGDGHKILTDGRVGYFSSEDITVPLTEATQRGLVEKLPAPINERAFIIEDAQITFKSWVFVQTNKDETDNNDE